MYNFDSLRRCVINRKLTIPKPFVLALILILAEEPYDLEKEPTIEKRHTSLGELE